MTSGTLIFDLETWAAELRYTMDPYEFVRLGGYMWRGENKVHITTDVDELREQVLKARWIVGHNIHSFDLPALFGTKSDIPMQLADEGRVYDTWAHAPLVYPAPYKYYDRDNKERTVTDVAHAYHWYSLDNLAHQLKVPGKTHKLNDLQKEFGGFDKIPTDDPRFIEYLEGDVRASNAVAQALLKKGPLNKYALREQRIASRFATISANGWRVDMPRAQARVEELKTRRDTIMAGLVEKYDFPTTGKQPWKSAAGKRAIVKALTDYGITEADWPRTAATVAHPTGQLRFGGKVILALTEGTKAEEIGAALAELQGQRSLAQLALDSTHSDGFVHPSITMLQRSGRTSTTNPGLTVWTARGPGAIEKAYFIADNDDEVIIEADYSNADARAVAAYSGDEKFAERFKPGKDGHMINAILAWGEGKVAADPKHYRQMAKAPGHGWGYRMGAKKMALGTGLPFTECRNFLSALNREYSKVVAWQDRTSSYAAVHGHVVNEWGRVMRVDKDSAYTQGPALVGQSTTREVACDFLLKLPHSAMRRVKGFIHDAFAFSVPRATAAKWQKFFSDKMFAAIHPAGGQRMEFPVELGPVGDNWYEAGH